MREEQWTADGEPPKGTDEPTTPFARAVCEVVAAIPAGTVSTYGEVASRAAARLGRDDLRPLAARSVGQILARCGGTLPWWRVVTVTGALVPHSEATHRWWLESEGVELDARGVVALRRSRPS
ncbi:MAG: MGMT family protein [Actinomycetota bacterium]